MQYSFVKSCLVALAAVSGVVAQTAGFDVFTQPLTPGTSIPAGSTYTIKWTPSSPAGLVSIVLLEGSSNITLQIGPKVASGIDSTTGSYDWKVPSSMSPVFPIYGLKIQLDSDPTTYQYSTYFSISGLTTSSAAAPSSGSATGSTSVSASTTVTVMVSSVSATTSTAVTTLSASLVTISNGTSGIASSTGGVYSNTTITSKTTAVVSGVTSTASSTTSAATTSPSSAAGSVAIGSGGFLGALMVMFAMLV